MDFFLFGLAGDDLAQEPYELSAGMARSGFAQHLTGAGVERRVQRKSPMPVIVKHGPSIVQFAGAPSTSERILMGRDS